MVRRTDSKKKGAARMQELGYKPVQIWLSPNDWERAKKVARSDRRPLAQWVRLVVNTAAREAKIDDVAELARKAKDELENRRTAIDDPD